MKQIVVGSEMREVLENIHVVDMNVPDGIKEYALLTIKFEAIYNAVFENVANGVP